MTLKDQNPPPEMVIPDVVEIKPSEVDTKRNGIWCKTTIKEGSKFGPFLGEIVEEATDEMDPVFVWEIVNLETKEFLHYINATNPHQGNWMRYINCARFFEEQNIVSEQEGTDIFYRAIKDINPDEELLTWYERAPFKKKKSKKKSPTKENISKVPKEPIEGTVAANVSEKQKEPVEENPSPTKPLPQAAEPVEEEVRAAPEDISQRGRKRKVTKFWEMEDYTSENSAEEFEDESQHGEELMQQVNSDAETVDYSDEEWSSNTAGLSIVEKSKAVKVELDASDSKIKGNFYQFDLKPFHVVKSRVGRKVFKCDICSGVYRHSFSLKRHYIRNHINYVYVSKTDLLNCNIPFNVVEVAEAKRAELFSLADDEKENIEGASETVDKQIIDDGSSKNSETVEDIVKDTVNIDAETSEKYGKVDAIDDGKEFPSNDDKSDKDSKITNGDDSDRTSEGKSEEMEIDDVTVKDEIKSEPNDINKEEVNVGSELEKYLTGLKSCEPDKTGDTPAAGDSPARESSESVPLGEDAPTPMGLSLPGAGTPGLYRCNICEQLMDDVFQLKDHLVNHPDATDNGKAFSCDRCDMKFAQKQNLMRHQAVHTGAKLFACNTCNKKFPTMKNLRRHEKIHQKPTCDLCGTTFTQSADLKKHVRKIHPDRFFECGFCARHYLSGEQLSEHLAQQHQQDRDGNERELEVRGGGGEFKVDPLKDRKESMRIASHMKATSLSPVKPGFKFACTVCKKRFHSYANMCRHRRLAHQRHMLQLHYRQKDDDEDETEVFHKSPFSSPVKAAMMGAKATNTYFASVAQNIADNLSQHMAGTRDYISQPEKVIKWMGGGEKAMTVKDDDDAGCAPLEIYNFPSGYKLKKPYELLRPVKLFGKAAKQAKLAQEAVSPVKAGYTSPTAPLTITTPPLPTLTRRPDPALPGSANGVPPRGSGQSLILSPPNASKSDKKECPLPIRVPQVKMCKICRCIFHKHVTYQDHMLKRHKLIINDDDEDEDEDKPADKPDLPGHKVKTEPTVADDEPLTPVDLTIGPLALGLTRASSVPGDKLGDSKSDSSPSRETDTDDVKPLDLSGPLDLTKEGIPIDDDEIPSINKRLYFHPKKVLCDLCYRQFGSRLEVFEHQDRDHGRHVECGVMEVDKEFNPTWRLQPDPLGLLNVSTSQVPLRQGTSKRRQAYNCTKCSKTLNSVEELHGHIMQCAEPYYPKFVYTYVVRSGYWQGYATRALDSYDARNPNRQLGKYRRGAARRNNKQQTPKKKKKSSISNLPSEEALDSASVKRQAEADEEAERKRKRRNPYALLYNPNNHIRRREMTEITNLQKCQGCEKEFRTISLLERHIPVCSHKEKIKEFHESAPPSPEPEEEEEPWDPTKHMCIYCEKLFTYIGMLRKHIFDTCPVRADYVEREEYIDEEWEQDINDKADAKQETWKDTPSKQSNEDDNNSDSHQGDMRGRKRKRNRHNWGYKPKTNSPLPRQGEHGEIRPFFGIGDSSNSSDTFSSRVDNSSDSASRPGADRKDIKSEINFANKIIRTKSVESVKKDIKRELDNSVEPVGNRKSDRGAKIKTEPVAEDKSDFKTGKNGKTSATKTTSKITAANPILAQSILKPPVMTTTLPHQTSADTPTVKAQLAKKIKEGRSPVKNSKKATAIKGKATAKKKTAAKFISKKIKVAVAKKAAKSVKAASKAPAKKMTRTAVAKSVIQKGVAAKKVLKRGPKGRPAAVKPAPAPVPETTEPKVRRKPGPKPGSKRKKPSLEMICLTKSTATKAASALVDANTEPSSDIENTDIKLQKAPATKKKIVKTKGQAKKGLAKPKGGASLSTPGKSAAPKGKAAAKQQTTPKTKTITARKTATPKTAVPAPTAVKAKVANAVAKSNTTTPGKTQVSTTKKPLASASSKVAANNTPKGSAGKPAAQKTPGTAGKPTQNASQKSSPSLAGKPMGKATTKTNAKVSPASVGKPLNTSAKAPAKVAKTKAATTKTSKAMVHKTGSLRVTETDGNSPPIPTSKAKTTKNSPALKKAPVRATVTPNQGKAKASVKGKAVTPDKPNSKRKIGASKPERDQSPASDACSEPVKRARKDTTPTRAKSATPSPVRRAKANTPTPRNVSPLVKAPQRNTATPSLGKTTVITAKRAQSPTKSASMDSPVNATSTIITVTTSSAKHARRTPSPSKPASSSKTIVSKAATTRDKSPEKRAPPKKETAAIVKATNSKTSQTVAVKKKGEIEMCSAKGEAMGTSSPALVDKTTVSTEEKIKKALKTLKEVLNTDESETEVEDSVTIDDEDWDRESQDVEMESDDTEYEN